MFPGLPNRVLVGVRENLPRRYPQHDSDVFAFVKRYISDDDYSQRRLVVYPGSVQRETIRALQRLSGPNCQGRRPSPNQPGEPCMCIVVRVFISPNMFRGVARRLDDARPTNTQSWQIGWRRRFQTGTAVGCTTCASSQARQPCRKKLYLGFHGWRRTRSSLRPPVELCCRIPWRMIPTT